MSNIIHHGPGHFKYRTKLVHDIHLRLTYETYSKLVQAAFNDGIGISEFVRSRINEIVGEPNE